MSAEIVNAECRNGHAHTYAGPDRRPVKCKTCRISVWIPKQGMAAQPADDNTAPTLTALWARESPPGSTLPPDPARYPVPCSKCGGERVWEGRRTMIYCPDCHKMTIPRFVVDRFEQRQAGGETSREVAVRDPSAAELRQVAAVLAGHRETMLDTIRKAVQTLDVQDLDDSPARREAVRWHGALSSYATHIRNAETTEALAEIHDEILVLLPQYQQVAANVRQERERLERHHRAVEQEQEQRAAIEAAYVEYEEPERPTMAPVRPVAPLTPYPVAAAAFAQMLVTRQERREALGPCPFRHHNWTRPRAVCRLFPVYTEQSTTRIPGSPEIRACDKHRDTAMAWFGEQDGGYYWIHTEEL
jgi:hypothetical protein